MKYWLLRAAVAAIAVALGIGVGAGPLQRSDRERDDQLAAQKADSASKQREINALRWGAAFADGYAEGTAPTLLRGTLAGRSIAVVTLPGADEETVKGLLADIALAQGQVTAQVQLDDSLAGSTSRQLVEALTSQMVAQSHLAVPSDAAGYERFGALLARALGTGPTGRPPRATYDPTAAGIVSGLQTADLVTLTKPVSARAGLALVVAGPEADSDAAAADNAVPVAILDAFGRALPTVVVGSTGASSELGVIGALRASSTARKAVSTMDSAETRMGQIAGVLALAARARGTVGHYGAVDAADGVVPGAEQ